MACAVITPRARRSRKVYPDEPPTDCASSAAVKKTLAAMVFVMKPCILARCRIELSIA
jgi:hypothetical protein